MLYILYSLQCVCIYQMSRSFLRFTLPDCTSSLILLLIPYSCRRFVSRAKLIKNHAVINEDVEGDRQALQAEIRHLKRLNAELQVDLD